MSFGTTSLSPETMRMPARMGPSTSATVCTSRWKNQPMSAAPVGTTMEPSKSSQFHVACGSPVQFTGLDAGNVVRAGKAQPLAFRQLALARNPAALLLYPVDALGQAVAVHHQVVVGEGGRLQQVGAPHGRRIEAHLARHLVEQARRRSARRPCRGRGRRRTAAYWSAPLADVLDVVQVVDGVEHRAGIEES